MSPRPTVRVADVDAYGQVRNVYSSTRSVSGSRPDVPWAVHLADAKKGFRLLVFDLDAKGAHDAERAERDTQTVCELLAAIGIEHVVCASGPDGGRHVWVALAESVDAATISTLAYLTQVLCPSLDLSPITNAGAGCVRPPGSPHRRGGVSTVLSGDLRTLTAPATTPSQVLALLERVATLAVDVAAKTEPASPLRPGTPLPLDSRGHLYLPGTRRALPAASAAALQEKAGGDDASGTLWRILVGAAGARWRYDDVAALVSTAPGLEHVRTMREGTDRVPRPKDGQASAAAILRRQWKKAVWHVSSSSSSVGNDPTFDARAAAITDHVQEVQARADASAGRWATRGGPADRRILDALCALALQAVSEDLEADIRRLALLVGIGRETARQALLRLASDGWITQTQPAEGPHGAHWSIDPQSTIHRDDESARSQGLPRALGAGTAQRSVLLASLFDRLSDARHDTFTPAGGLGHHIGNLFSRTSPTPQTLEELARAVGGTPAQTLLDLDRLAQHGLVHAGVDGWTRPRGDRRRAVALRLGVAGRLAARVARYRLERELWAWWQTEQAWMSAPRRTDASRRAGYGQLALLPDEGTGIYGAHPRRMDGRADYRRARGLLIAKRAPLAAITGAA